MEADSLLKVKFYHPDEDIRWLVRKFEAIKYDGTSLPFSDNFIPRPDVALVFNFKSIPTILHPENIQLKPFFVAAIPVRPMQLSLKEEVNSLIVICNPTVFSKVFKMKLVNSIPVIENFDQTLIHLWNELAKKETDIERINCFADYIKSIVPGGYQPDVVDKVYNDIQETCLQKSLKDITEDVPCSLSSLQRNFLKRTGISMKKLIRIARVHTIFETMLNEKQFDFRKIFFESNYYDQSHFIKDFKEITGKSPTQFFKQNSEMLRIISGMEVLT